MKRKERDTHIGGGYVQDFGDEIPQRQPQEQQQPEENNNNTQENNKDTEPTTSNNSEDAVATHEPGACQAIPVQEYRDGPIADIAVRYVRINRIVEQKVKRNRQQEDNIRSAELDFMLDLETLIKETAADPDLIELNCCIEDNNLEQIPRNYKIVAKKPTHRWGIIMVNDRIVISKSLRCSFLNELHFGHHGINVCVTIRLYSGGQTCEKIIGGAFISKEYKEFCREQNTDRTYGTANLHTGTGLIERTIQSLKNLVLVNLKDEKNLRESVNRALYVRRFTIHSETKKTSSNPSPFGRAPRTRLSNLKNSVSVDSKDLSVYITPNSAGEITDHLVMSKKETVEPKFRRGMTFSQTKKLTRSVSMNKFEYLFTFYEKNFKKGSLESKFKNKFQTAVSGTKHTITTDKNKIVH